MIVVFPTLPAFEGKDVFSGDAFKRMVPYYEKITLDDYKWNAEQINRLGAKLKADGIKLGYHNHAIDFKDFEGAPALDWLMRLTDPNLVTFELDCGHVIHSGHNPVEFLRDHSSRITLLHLKDLKPGFEVSTSFDTEDKGTNVAIGEGSINWTKLFAEAKYVKHYFVEHEGKMARDHMQEIAQSYRYLQSLS